MEIIKPNILIIGENIYSIFLSYLLKNSGFDSIILSQNKSALLFNPIMRYYDKNSEAYKGLNTEKIKEFIKELCFVHFDDFSPIEALYISGDIVRCSALYKFYNYYEEAKRENTKITFVNIENLQDTITPIKEPDRQIELLKIRVLQKERIYSIYELASILENDNESLKAIAQELQENTGENRNIIVLPPILGVSNTERIREFLTHSLKRKIFEALTFNPVVISKRFFLLLEAFETKNDIKVIYDTITKIQTEYKEIKAITTQNYEIHPQKIILMSERFTEDGLTIKDNKVVEPLFNLPVFFTNHKNEISYFTEEDILDKHHIFSCGIKTDKYFMPIDIFNNTLFKNLYSVGSIVIDNPDILKNLSDTYRLFTILKESIRR